jgi:hypothetical protein
MYRQRRSRNFSRIQSMSLKKWHSHRSARLRQPQRDWRQRREKVLKEGLLSVTSLELAARRVLKVDTLLIIRVGS